MAFEITLPLQSQRVGIRFLYNCLGVFLSSTPTFVASTLGFSSLFSQSLCSLQSNRDESDRENRFAWTGECVQRVPLPCETSAEFTLSFPTGDSGPCEVLGRSESSNYAKCEGSRERRCAVVSLSPFRSMPAYFLNFPSSHRGHSDIDGVRARSAPSSLKKTLEAPRAQESWPA